MIGESKVFLYNNVSSNIYNLYSFDIMVWFITKWLIDYSFKLKLFNTSFDLKSKIDFSNSLGKTFYSFGAITFNFNIAFISGWPKYVYILWKLYGPIWSIQCCNPTPLRL